MKNDLPTELWLSIWVQLSVTDRIAASRVCKRWRLDTLGSAGLWTHVHIHCTDHFVTCECDEAWDTSSACRRRKGLLGVERMLSYSRDAQVPLTVSITCMNGQVDERIARRVGQVLQPHAHRVVSLLFKSQNRYGLRAFFCASPEFVSLERLYVHLIPDAERQYKTGFEWAKVKLPALRHLDVHGVHREIDRQPPLPSLVTLSVLFAWTKELSHYLTVASKLERLEICVVSSRYGEAIRNYEALGPLIARIRDVHVAGIALPHDEECFLAMLQDRPQRSLSFSYGRILRELPYNASRVLRDVFPPSRVRLSVSKNDNCRVSLRATSKGGRTRAICGISFSRAVSIMETHAIPQFYSLDVDVGLFPDVLASGLAVFERVGELTLFRCRTVHDLTYAAVPRRGDPFTTRQTREPLKMGNLDILRIAFIGDHIISPAEYKQLADVVHSLTCDRVLITLALTGCDVGADSLPLFLAQAFEVVVNGEAIMHGRRSMSES